VGTPLQRVTAWLDDVRELDVAALCPHLSPVGARAALDAALDPLAPKPLSAAVQRTPRAFPHAVMVVARTVFTAPLEWAAVLLGRGTSLLLKPSSADRGFTDALVELARAHDLPLGRTEDRAAVGRAPLVVAMGSDATVEAIRSQVASDARYLGFGHRFGAAWLTTEDGFRAIGPDLALHDGLGCMSPAAVFTDWPLDDAVAALAESWRRIDAAWPSGPRDPASGARIREREARARVLGRVAKGPGWSVHALPIERFQPAALPRSTALHRVAGADGMAALLHRYEDVLSTFATDHPALAVPAGARRCAPGAMQRPPLDRLHDGVDWLSETGLS